MAISIDTVYQKVLAITNKEQRGYITPHEFNLFADHVQMEIFEQYFYDLNQFKRIPGNNGEYSDIVPIIKDKITQFEHWAAGYNITVLNEWGDVNLEEDLPDLYRLGEVSVFYGHLLPHHSIACEQLTPKEFTLYARSKLTKPTGLRPVFVKYTSGYSRIKIYPYPTASDGLPITTPTKWGVKADYIRKPKKPNWGYIVVNDKPLYNASESTDFELHASEESELVYRILTLFGINLREPQLAQTAVALESSKVQQEKS